MYLEAVRLLADWFSGALKDWQNTDKGINALSAGVPRWGSDAAPPTVTIEDETRHPELARNRPTSVMPGVGVKLHRPIVTPGLPMTTHIDAEEVEVLAFVCFEDPDSAKAVQHELYIMRAITRSIRQFARNENMAKRQADSIALVTCTRVQRFPRQPIAEDEGSHVITGVVSTWHVRDLAP